MKPIRLTKSSLTDAKICIFHNWEYYSLVDAEKGGFIHIETTTDMVYLDGYRPIQYVDIYAKSAKVICFKSNLETYDLDGEIRYCIQSHKTLVGTDISYGEMKGTLEFLYPEWYKKCVAIVEKLKYH